MSDTDVDVDDMIEEDQDLMMQDAAGPHAAHPDADAHPDATAQAAIAPTRKRSLAEIMADEDARIARLEATVMSGGGGAAEAEDTASSASAAAPSAAAAASSYHSAAADDNYDEAAGPPLDPLQQHAVDTALSGRSSSSLAGQARASRSPCAGSSSNCD